MQLALPAFDLRPLCAICRQPSSLIGSESGKHRALNIWKMTQ